MNIYRDGRKPSALAVGSVKIALRCVEVSLLAKKPSAFLPDNLARR